MKEYPYDMNYVVKDVICIIKDDIEGIIKQKMGDSEFSSVISLIEVLDIFKTEDVISGLFGKDILEKVLKVFEIRQFIKNSIHKEVY